MALSFRLARPGEQPLLEAMVIDSFEPITWAKKLDERFGPLSGCDWRARWHTRMEKVFRDEIVLVGETDGEVVALASGTYEEPARFGYIDILAVDRQRQGKGYGREMLRGMMEHFRGLGAEQVHLECLADNECGNSLYRSEGFVEVARSIHWFLKLA
jgi:ribosomal protein S18 acetylase RimI-like enzyme